MDSLILAIDCGSTNLKAALFTAELERVAEHSVPTPYSRQDAEAVELDPEHVWNAALTLIRETCVKASVAEKEIDAIALASQAQTFTVLDEAGNARMPFISWLDKRGADEAKELSEVVGIDFHFHCSWPEPLAELRISKALWLSRQQPDIFEGKCSIVSLPSFLIFTMAGVHVLDRNLAAMSGMYSLKDEDWWWTVIEMCGIGKHSLPELVDVGEGVLRRASSRDLGLSESVRIVLAGNDQTAGAYGNGCGPHQVIGTLGTALVAYRFAGNSPGPDSAKAAWGPYPGGGYYEMAVLNEGCLALDWARTHVAGAESIEVFMRLAEEGRATVENSDVFFYPGHMGSDKAWTGDGEPAERAFAVIEGISFAFRRLALEDLACGKGVSFRIIGGGSKSDFWLQLIADILERVVSRGTGDSLLGAARMAVSHGKEHKLPATEMSVFSPDTSASRMFEKRYAAWNMTK